MCPLDESAGEGVHRADTHEKARAPGSTPIHIKQAARERDVLSYTGSFLDQYGERGRKVFRFEWRFWKRLLNTSLKNRWVGRKWKPMAVLKRIYREDAFSQQNWQAIAFKMGSVGQPVRERVTVDDQVRDEYLKSTFEHGRYYSVPTQETTIDEEGHAVDETAEAYFNVVDVVHASSRPHLMPTVESASDPVLTKHLTLNVQFYCRFQHPEFDADDDRRPQVYAEANEEWVIPTQLGDFETLHKQMRDWTLYRPSPVLEGCVQLEQPRVAQPHVDVMDPKCSTLVVFEALKDIGWTPVEALCDHRSACVETFDGWSCVNSYAALLSDPFANS